MMKAPMSMHPLAVMNRCTSRRFSKVALYHIYIMLIKYVNRPKRMNKTPRIRIMKYFGLSNSLANLLSLMDWILSFIT